MSIHFSCIDDTKYHFISETSLRNTIINSGRKKIVFVEGYDDKIIFDILFSENLDKLAFIDVSLEAAKRTSNETIEATGGCETVKGLLENCVSSIPQEKRFYGIVDRDLKTDNERDEEKNDLIYDGRLFIFLERYTLENYFVTLPILFEFVKGQSCHQKKLIPLIQSKTDFQENILSPIEFYLINIGIANLTIKYFNDLKQEGEARIPSLNKTIKNENYRGSS